MDIFVKQVGFGTDLPLPAYATIGSAGLDLMAAIEQDIVIAPHTRAMIPTGISLSLPSGVEGQVRSRSGLAAKHGIYVLNSPGTIDSDFRGEIAVILMNSGIEPFVVTQGMRIAQLVVARYITANLLPSESLDETVRSEGGFGSTGYGSGAISGDASQNSA